MCVRELILRIFDAKIIYIYISHTEHGTSNNSVYSVC